MADPGQHDMDRTEREMQHDLDAVEANIDEARAKAPDARLDDPENAGGELQDLSGDVSGQEGGPMFGDDPTGAVDDERAR